ncbi:MAG: fibrobacter succinogenes major paralogous domain-containing protein [Saprospiraceae bacterium]|nr:fibrobacter succinogenes major paralogous domain-containing protein [Saprospiraceae bacterium]
MKYLFTALFLSWLIPLVSQEIGLSIAGTIQLGNPSEIPPVGGMLFWDGENFLGVDSLNFRLMTNARFGSVTDRDGNLYRTVRIGIQWWMIENLRTATFADGSPIQLDSSDAAWSVGNSAYCWYDNDSSNYEHLYGKLYNWYAVSDVHGLCPEGWHVPTDSDWLTLATQLGGQEICGGKMKELGSSHWLPANAAATNESGFTAKPAGLRSINGAFLNLNHIGYWWASNVSGASAWYGNLYNYNGTLDVNLGDKLNGLSVRCVD